MKKKNDLLLTFCRAELKNPHPYHPNAFQVQEVRSATGDLEAAQMREMIPVGSPRAAILPNGRKEGALTQSQAPGRSQKSSPGPEQRGI